MSPTTRFIGAAIQPDAATFDTARMAAGEPGLPKVFNWNAHAIRIVSVIRTWRETGPCDHGSGDIYVRKHWYEVTTDTGQTMKIYFDRQPRARQGKVRWWLFSVQDPE